MSANLQRGLVLVDGQALYRVLPHGRREVLPKGEGQQSTQAMKRSFLYYPKRAGRRLRDMSLIAVAIVGAFVTSCAVVFVGPYDEITDKAINDLAMQTEQFLAKMEATGGDYESNRSFYRDAKASIRSIRLRAELYEKNEGELKELVLLDQNFDNLAKLHRLGSLTGITGSIARTQIEANFKSLIQIELAKKRSSGVSKTTS
jgi:hypothetical protein